MISVYVVDEEGKQHRREEERARKEKLYLEKGYIYCGPFKYK